MVGLAWGVLPLQLKSEANNESHCKMSNPAVEQLHPSEHHTGNDSPHEVISPISEVTSHELISPYEVNKQQRWLLEAWPKQKQTTYSNRICL